MKNRKGFTLIELLTVIAILAVILLIAAPTILGVLDKARKNTFKNQVLLYVEAAKTQMALTAMGEGYYSVEVNTPDKGATETVDVARLNPIMDNAALTSGNILIVADASGNLTYKVQSVTDEKTYTTPSTPTVASELSESDITKYTSGS